MAVIHWSHILLRLLRLRPRVQSPMLDAIEMLIEDGNVDSRRVSQLAFRHSIVEWKRKR